MDVKRFREQITAAMKDDGVVNELIDTLRHLDDEAEAYGGAPLLFPADSTEDRDARAFANTVMMRFGAFDTDLSANESEAATGGFLIGLAVAQELESAAINDAEADSPHHTD